MADSDALERFNLMNQEHGIGENDDQQVDDEEADGTTRSSDDDDDDDDDDDGEEEDEEEEEQPEFEAPSSGSFEHACVYGMIQVVRRMLLEGADPNTITRYHDLAVLPIAIRCGHTNVARILLDFGARIEDHNDHSYSALHYAAYHGNLEIVHELLARGAEVNCIGANGSTPLHTAVWKDHVEIVRVLLERGADLTTPNVRIGVGVLYSRYFASESRYLMSEIFDE